MLNHPLPINHNSHHNIPSSSQRHSGNPCWHSTSPPPRRSRSGDQFNYYQCCPNNCQDQAFSYGTNPKAHLICAVCLGTHTHTMFTHATPPEHGMAIIQQWPKGPEVTFTYERMTCPSVWIGKCLEDALVPSTTSNTFA